MSDSFMDRLPSREQEKIKKRMRSPEAYEKLRDKVKGPEDLEKELNQQEKLAEVSFEFESSPELQKQAKEMMIEKGIEQAIDMDDLSPEAKAQIEKGNFTVSVDHEAKSLSAVPEGNVQERIPLTPIMSDKIISGLSLKF